ncbi:MAG: hypothetical protein AAF479_08300 [Pseudomonadota bacterium]
MNIDSTSDERTANNSTRQEYRKLSDEEKADMSAVKQLGADLIELICSIGHECVPCENECLDERNLELARRHIEDGVMRAVRHITA